MTRVEEGESCTGRERLFIEMAIAAHRMRSNVCHPSEPRFPLMATTSA
jgi:hypothetical protein